MAGATDIDILINEYIDAESSEDENKINKLIENKIAAIQRPTPEELQLWANVVSKLQQLRKLLHSILRALMLI